MAIPLINSSFHITLYYPAVTFSCISLPHNMSFIRVCTYVCSLAFLSSRALQIEYSVLLFPPLELSVFFFSQFVTALLCILTTYCFSSSEIAISISPPFLLSLSPLGSITFTTCGGSVPTITLCPTNKKQRHTGASTKRVA